MIVIHFFSEEFDGSLYEFYCSNCDSHVEDKSKHCKRCNRCVSNFDHHCKWVNNCIGGKNYRIFLCLVVIVFISCGIFCFIVGFFAKLYFSENGPEKTLENSKGFIEDEINLRPLLIITLIFGAFTFIFVILDFNLILFHLWLIKNKFTTYEYILEKRKDTSKKIVLIYLLYITLFRKKQNQKIWKQRI